MEIKSFFPLQQYNTFRVNVRAKGFVEINYPDSLGLLFEKILPRYDDYLILGGGSNLLFTRDFEGLVIHMNLKGIEIMEEDEKDIRLRVKAGEDWTQFVDYCVANGWGGVENLALIPGQVGAAPVQNIGAYGVESGDVIESVEAFDLKTGKMASFTNKDCEFGYRNSIFKTHFPARYLITAVVFSLSKVSPLQLNYGALKQELRSVVAPTYRHVAEIVKHIRRTKLPDIEEIGSAGSFFKNPVLTKEHFYSLQENYPEIPSYTVSDGVKVPAGWLIEQCGWKGFRQGHIGVYPRQALVLVNYSDASGSELKQLAERIREDVYKTFAINLIPEVTII